MGSRFKPSFLLKIFCESPDINPQIRMSNKMLNIKLGMYEFIVMSSYLGEEAESSFDLSDLIISN